METSILIIFLALNSLFLFLEISLGTERTKRIKQLVDENSELKKHLENYKQVIVENNKSKGNRWNGQRLC